MSPCRPQSIQFRVSSAELAGPRTQVGELAFQRNRPRAPAPQLVCLGLRPCRRGRAHRARVAVLESDATPCSRALPAPPAPRVPAEAAPSPWDFDGLGQATPRARRPPAVPSPAPAPVPAPRRAAPRRQRSSCSQHAASLMQRPPLVPWTLSPPIRRPGPAFEETCWFHQEVERSAPEGWWTSPAPISQGPASLGTQCGAGSSALSPLPPLPQWILPIQRPF